MSVRTDGAVAILEGDCPIEDAEALLQHLLLSENSTVDWRLCESAHTAVIQVLIVAKPTLLGPPRSAFFSRWITQQFTARK